MKDRPLEDEIHARLRQLTSEVRALRQDIQADLQKPPKRAIQTLSVKQPQSADEKQPRRNKKKKR